MEKKNKLDICCIGHLTQDKIVTTKSTIYQPGGTSFYFSNSISNMDLNYMLVTAVAKPEMKNVEDLRAQGIDVKCFESHKTVFFENIYGENQDNRTQRVRAKADPFLIENLEDINASYFHLGPLLADDFSADFIKVLSAQGIVSVDAQGFLREVVGTDVHHIDWEDKMEVLPYIDILKVNEKEMEVLTGTSDIRTGAKILSDWGVGEVIVTLGSMGSVILAEGEYYTIPSFKPKTEVVDATGCGDTYMAGYLYEKVNDKDVQACGEFAAAMATLNIEAFGPFHGTKEDVEKQLQSAERFLPVLQ